MKEQDDIIATQTIILDGPQANVQPLIEAKAQEKKEATVQVRKLQADHEKLRSELETLQRERTTIHNEIERRTRRLNELSNVDTQKKQAAARWEATIGWVVDWIEKAPPGTFDAQVCYPPIISVNVPDKQYAWMVEMCTNVAQRKASCDIKVHIY